MNGRAFIWRWAGRVVRNEWRQHIVILGLLIAGVTAAVALGVTAYNLGDPETKYQGHAQLIADSTDPSAFGQALTDSDISFGVIQHLSVERDGSTQAALLRTIDPDNAVVAPLIALVDGRYPTVDGEVALTDRAFADQIDIGSTVDIDGVSLTIVGTIENPMSLDDEFAMVTTVDGFASADETQTDFYVDADMATVERTAGNLVQGITTNEGPSQQVSGLIGNVVGAFGMLEVALLVSSAFAVIAKRRERQYGLLAAAGAPPKLVRSAAMASGLILGIIGALIGLVIGLLVARVLVGALEGTLNHRIAFAASLSALAPNVILAVAIAAWAARRPAVKLSKKSVIGVLSATRPKAEPVGRVAIVGAVITVLGGALLVTGFTNFNVAMALGGVVLAPLGLLMLSPLLVGAIGRAARRLPLEARLAGRAISRYNRRSAAVVAAIALALSIPAGIAVVTESIDARAVNTDPNLATDSAVIWAGEIAGYTPSQLPIAIDEASLSEAMEQASAAAPELAFVPIDIAFPPGYLNETMIEDGRPEAANPLLAFRPVTEQCAFCSSDTFGFGGDIEYDARTAWIGSPELLDALGMEADWLDSSSVALVEQSGDALGANGILGEGEQVTVASSWPGAAAVPNVFVAPDLIAAGDYEVVTIGWLGTSDAAITAAQTEAIREAVTTSVDVEFHEPPAPKSGLRTTGLMIGLIAGIGITISAVSLLAAEQRRDIALLASLGARPTSGRRMSAAMAALLAFSGAAVAMLIGYVPLLPMINSSVDNFPFVVPFQFFFGLLIVFPLIAAATGLFMNRRAVQGVSLSELV